MTPFDANARVCFVGDSITMAGYWEACIADYYRTHCPERHVKFFPCGLAGGTCLTSLRHLQEMLMPFDPTHAVILMGTNDIRFGLDEEPASQKTRQEREDALCNYEARLRALSEVLAGTVKRLTYLTPLLLDGRQKSETVHYPRRNQALLRCGDSMWRVAAEFGGEVVDLSAAMQQTLDTVYDAGLAVPLFQPDRTHPTLLGASVMARILLREMGFPVAQATVNTLADGGAKIRLSEPGERFYTAEVNWQKFWTAQFLIGDFAPDQTPAGRLAFATEYGSQHPDADEFFLELAAFLVQENGNREGLRAALQSAADEMAVL